jgi:hypothetical protein
MKTLIILTLAVTLVGCGSAPRVTAKKPQYCHTSQTIETTNGEKVNSTTVVECTDDQVKKMSSVKLGLSRNCGEFTYWMQIGGQNVQRKGISCQKLDGTWEVINTSGY